MVLVVGLAVVGCSTGGLKQTIADKDNRIGQLEQEVASLKGKLAEDQARLQRVNADLESALADFKQKEQVWVEKEKARSVITISDAVMFTSGGVDVTPEGRAIMDRIAEVAKKYPDRLIEIQGHTDDVPIGAALKEKYRSNWELAGARACSVLHYLYWKHKIDPARLSAIGYGEYRPLADNDTPEGRARNRRVVIAIGPKLE